MLERLKMFLEKIKDFPKIFTSTNNIVVDAVELNNEDYIKAFKNIEKYEKQISNNKNDKRNNKIEKIDINSERNNISSKYSVKDNNSKSSENEREDI